MCGWVWNVIASSVIFLILGHSERSYGDDDEEEEVNAKAEGSKVVERPIPKSSLPSPIQEFIMLVFSTRFVLPLCMWIFAQFI